MILYSIHLKIKKKKRVYYCLFKLTYKAFSTLSAIFSDIKLSILLMFWYCEIYLGSSIDCYYI